MILLVGWDKRQLSRAGPPYAGRRLVGRRSPSLACPTLLWKDQSSDVCECGKRFRTNCCYMIVWRWRQGASAEKSDFWSDCYSRVGTAWHDPSWKYLLYRAGVRFESQTGSEFKYGRKGGSDVFRESTRRRPLPSMFLSQFNGVIFCQKNLSRDIGHKLSPTYRRKRTLALRGRNQRRDTSEQAGKRPLHSVDGFLRRCLHLSRSSCWTFICPAHALKNPGRRPPAIWNLKF